MTTARVWCRGAVAALAALVVVVDGAALTPSEDSILGAADVPRAIRVRRQQYGSEEYDERYPQNNNNNNRYPANNNRGWAGRQDEGRLGEDQDQYGGVVRNSGGARTSRTRNGVAANGASPTSSARQSSSDQGGFRPQGTGSSQPPVATRQFGGGVESNGYFGSDNGDGYYGGAGGGNGLFGGGGGLFGSNRPSIIGGLIRRIGLGLANTMQGVSAALANKWSTKAAAARGVAASLFDTGRVATRAGIQAGLAHPRFAVEALENVF